MLCTHRSCPADVTWWPTDGLSIRLGPDALSHASGWLMTRRLNGIDWKLNLFYKRLRMPWRVPIVKTIVFARRSAGGYNTYLLTNSPFTVRPLDGDYYYRGPSYVVMEFMIRVNIVNNGGGEIQPSSNRLSACPVWILNCLTNEKWQFKKINLSVLTNNETVPYTTRTGDANDFFLP